MFFYYVLVAFVSFVCGVLLEFHPIIALCGTLCAIILKVIIDLLEYEFSDEPDA